MTTQHDELAAIIELHTMSTSDDTCCSCGAWFNTLAGAIDIQHRDHIADALIPFIERSEAQALRDAANEFFARLPDGTPNGRAYNSYKVAFILRDRADAIEKDTK